MGEDDGLIQESRQVASENCQPVHVGASPARTSGFSLFFVLRLVFPKAGRGKKSRGTLLFKDIGAEVLMRFFKFVLFCFLRTSFIKSNKYKNARLLEEETQFPPRSVTPPGANSQTHVTSHGGTCRVTHQHGGPYSGDLVLHRRTTTEIFILKWDQHRVSVPLSASAESKQCESALRPRKLNSRRL